MAESIQHIQDTAKYSNFGGGTTRFLLDAFAPFFTQTRSNTNLESPKIYLLELGCGQGQSFRRVIHPLLYNLAHAYERPICLSYTGLDINPKFLVEARDNPKTPEQFDFVCADATEICFPDDHFGLCIAAGLFTQIIDDASIRQVIKEMIRVSRYILILDFQILSFEYPPSCYTEKDYEEYYRRTKIYERRYKATHLALDRPYGTIISVLPTITVNGESLEKKFRQLEQTFEIEQLGKLYEENKPLVRLARHFDPFTFYNEVLAAGREIDPSFDATSFITNIPLKAPSSGKLLQEFSIMCGRFG